ncbi:MAG: IS3 family transposase [Companilactobacillus sp.]|uniref:IS3 family transposase n=1 Tax=Companilactobacillus sp. TaxID=2767905 RepID=UPI0025BF2233|nr:IS3 family transposase [Companilactobacillus sp.]MCH4008951.1 IS3 family transposase [Companilactobacillus sp.]MCH4009847.1 IS3 family transposase [Companilactobacillus sp.]MCH4009906.1 IS3 family transposase [Companilactobacillus sp.]MCH4050870.1 IS3 family transposase [Companilactobacillus sp.]MCH4052418.1 IS3 family transposase [Companilactobacillus sp.]
MNKQNRQAYQAIIEVCQNHHGWKSILLEYMGVSRQAFNKFVKRKESPWEKRNELLKKKVLEIYNFHTQTIGAGKILLNLRMEGSLEFGVTLKQIKRVMRELNIRCKSCTKKKDRQDDEDRYIKDNVLNQNFDAKAPNEIWLSDSTQLEFGIEQRQKIQLSGVLDLYGRHLIGFNLTPSETAEAETEMFENVFDKMGDVHPLVHTDRGSAYVSNKFNKLLSQHQVTRSMSRPGTPFDNAPMEHWWREFKNRWMDRFPTPTTFEELKRLVEAGINYFNNNDRSETRNGLTPAEYWNKAISLSL